MVSHQLGLVPENPETETACPMVQVVLIVIAKTRRVEKLFVTNPASRRRRRRRTRVTRCR